MAKNTSGFKNREFLQLGQVFEGQPIAGWYCSEKLDGVRSFWDGGITRGMRVEDVPFANLDNKDHLVDQHYATGLWSRYGNIQHAPDWFLDGMPKIPMDGELYLGRKRFEETVSIIRSHASGDRWMGITYKAFETLSFNDVFQVGMVNNPNMSKLIGSDVLPWVLAQAEKHGVKVLDRRQFITQVKLLELFVPNNDITSRHVQMELNRKESIAKVQVNEMLSEVLAGGGEGLIVRNPMATWIPKRCNHIFKLKDRLDSEGTVVGYVSGLGKLTGMMGALILEWQGKRFKLSGFDDAERAVEHDVSQWCVANPEQEFPSSLESHIFPRGSIVTFEYASLTTEGVPREARFLRKWNKV